MFKKNYDHLPRDVYFGNYKEATRGNPNYFLTYGNGKAAARVQNHLRPNGAHRWHNYRKSPKYSLLSLGSQTTSWSIILELFIQQKLLLHAFLLRNETLTCLSLLISIVASLLTERSNQKNRRFCTTLIPSFQILLQDVIVVVASLLRWMLRDVSCWSLTEL